MALVDINWNPNPTELRKFGVTMLVGFALIGVVLQFAFGKEIPAYVCYTLAALLGILGLSGTIAGLWAYRAWMGVAFVMGNIISRVLLALIYFGMFWPMGAIRRMLGADPLTLKKPNSTTFWTDAPPPTTRERAERQF
jgi:hypothetical protein